MIACVRLPYFAATLEARQDAAAADYPQIIVRYTATGRGKVSACCARAARAGVTTGMLVGRALALCPEARISPLNPARIRRARHEALLLLSAYSQWLEAERDGAQTAHIDIDLGKLRAAEGQQMAQQLMQRLSERLGLRAAVGLAANPFTAYAAAQQAEAGSTVLVTPGDEATFLAPLSVELLALERETARRLDLFGLVTLGQVAAIPRAALLEQFGKTGERMHRLASGEDKRRIARYRPPESEQAALSFEPPLEDRQIVGSILGRLAHELAGRLAARGLTCREITLSAHLADGTVLDDQRQMRQPVSERVTLERALRAGGVICDLRKLHPNDKLL